MIKVATLGPSGTNHELVTKRYLAFRGIRDAEVVLVPGFDDATRGLLGGEFDFIVQCAVHPATPQTMGTHFAEMFAADCFISPSKDLAVLTRTEVERPRTICLLRPATESYIDVSQWEEVIGGTSLPLIFEGLLAGRYDSALVYLEYAAQYPDRVRVDQELGSPDDVWIVYSRERTSNGLIQACADAPITGQFERLGAERR